VDLVRDPPVLRKSSKAGNRTRTSGSIARNSDAVSYCTDTRILDILILCLLISSGTHVAQWLRHYAKSRKGAGSKPDEVNNFTNLSSVFGRIRPCGLLSLCRK
jgi:hypothetical protein